MTVRLADGVREAVLGHGHEAAPREACGLLVGDEATGVVGRVSRVENVADGRDRYELAPADLLATIEAVEAAGEDHLGFYHTHPRGPAGPSATDTAEAAWPDFCYLIADLRDDVLGAWRWTGEQFDAVELTVGSADAPDRGETD